MKKTAFLTLLTISFLFAGCFSQPKPFTEDDNHTRVEFSLDTPFQIQLKGMHSSENSWRVISDNDAVVLKNTNVTTQENEDIYTFDFFVKSAGEEKITIAYGNANEQSDLFEMIIICGTMGRILSQ